ncbi:MAG: hypothetical protein KAW47_03750 [Thermoplasmatales archaeon]|nr:hypothetical protein [Thermoplasmatales archaeon]
MELIRDILAILGGAGIIILGLSKFLGGILRDRIKESGRRDTEGALEANRQRYGIRRIQTDKYAESQFDVYIKLWQTLQGLHLAVDSLWHRATKTNIEALARELTATKEKVNAWSIFFEKRHLKELNKLFKILENFRAGKIRLIEIRSREDMGYVFPDVIRDQIEQNRSFKEDFEKLLEELRVSFKLRLSEIEEPEFA